MKSKILQLQVVKSFEMLLFSVDVKLSHFDLEAHNLSSVRLPISEAYI